jgi:UDP-N-acetylglucosamine acyltransferase
MYRIHETAIVHSRAKLGSNVTIGPYAVIGAQVELGDHCVVGPYVCIDGWTTIGRGNRFFYGAAIGYEPQDQSYQGEKTYLIIGDYNIFRERVTINRGTAGGAGETRIGDGNLFMSASHVGHDCRVGDGNIMVDGSALAGHVILEDRVVVGRLSGVHQFCKVGKMVTIGTMTKIIKDVPPFLRVDGNPATVIGVDFERLYQNGVAREVCREIKIAYRLLYHSKLGVKQALEAMEQKLQNSMEVEYLIRFIRNAERGIQR